MGAALLKEHDVNACQERKRPTLHSTMLLLLLAVDLLIGKRDHYLMLHSGPEVDMVLMNSLG